MHPGPEVVRHQTKLTVLTVLAALHPDIADKILQLCEDVLRLRLRADQRLFDL